MSLNMASAFRLRNKLKERIKELTGLVQRAKVTTRKGEPENTAGFDGKTFAETIAEVSRLMAVLRDFNIAIDKANAVNREDLITLETLKAEIAFYEGIARDIRNIELRESEYLNGNYIWFDLVPVLDQKAVVAGLGSLKKKKDEIEERLANSNLNVPVDFDQSIISGLL